MFQFKNKYKIIACVNNSGCIGKDGQLLYRFRGDLKNFALLTTDNVVIMGRKTFESLPDGLPLKNRINIVVTSQDNYCPTEGKDESLFENTYVCRSLEEVDDLCYAYFSDRELYVIGGSSLYEESLNRGVVDELIITSVNDDRDGDTYFPDIQNDERYKVIFKTTSLRDQPNDVYYRYIVYKKKQEC